MGVIGGLWSYVDSERQSEEVAGQLDTFATLLSRAGLGNPYIEAIKHEIHQKGTCSDLENRLAKAIQANPKDTEALALLAISQTMRLSFMDWQSESNPNRQLHKSIEHVRRIANKGAALAPKKAVFIDALGILADIAGDHVRARKYFRLSSRLRADPYWHLLMATSWSQSGEHDHSLAEMRTAIKEGACGWLVEFYFGRALVNTGDYKQAVYHLERARQTRGINYPEVLRYLGVAYRFLGKSCKAACLDMRLSMMLLPIAARRSRRHLIEGMLNLLTCVISFGTKSIWKCVNQSGYWRNIYLSTLAKWWGPDEPESTLGVRLLQEGKYSGAKEMLKAAVEINPYDQSIWHNYAVALSCLNENDAAKVAYAKCIEINPTTEVASHSRENIDSISKRKLGEKIHLHSVGISKK